LSRIERNGAGLWTATQEDAAGRLIEAVLGNGLRVVQAHNAFRGRLYDRAVYSGQAMPLYETYLYDSVGNVSQRLQQWGSTMFSENFEYDELNRLSASTIAGYAPQTFTYDSIGNIKSKTGVGSYTYPDAGAKRPHAVSNIPGIGSFEYDANGNMTSGAGRTVTWNSFDMPMSITKTGSDTSTFYYGADHERVKQVRSGGTIWYAGAIEVEGDGARIKTLPAERHRRGDRKRRCQQGLLHARRPPGQPHRDQRRGGYAVRAAGVRRMGQAPRSGNPGDAGQHRRPDRQQGVHLGRNWYAHI
jgi:YD repeat-containing protein